jgi:acylphosphatase
MFDGIKDFFGFGEDARAYMVIQWRVYQGSFHFFVQQCVRYAGLKGWMRVVQKPMYDYIELEVEGSKYKINKLILTLQKGHKNEKASGLDITWKTYKEMYRDFQVRL